MPLITTKIWIRGFKNEKTYLHLLIFQPNDVDYWFPMFWKKTPQVCFKITDFIFGTKNNKINAFGSHLYMNLKKNDFWIC